MTALLWLIFAVAAMVAIFVTCALIVTAGVRLLERRLARRRRTQEEAKPA
jgi:hypothetical protein